MANNYYVNAYNGYYHGKGRRPFSLMDNWDSNLCDIYQFYGDPNKRAEVAARYLGYGLADKLKNYNMYDHLGTGLGQELKNNNIMQDYKELQSVWSQPLFSFFSGPPGLINNIGGEVNDGTRKGDGVVVKDSIRKGDVRRDSPTIPVGKNRTKPGSFDDY